MESTLPVCQFFSPSISDWVHTVIWHWLINCSFCDTAAASHKVKETAEDLSNSGVVNQVEGEAAHARGKAQELKGRAAGKVSEMSGKAQEVKGKVKGAAAEAKGKAKENLEEMQSNLFE
jgi:uncharacterized protein YjbJ (UPF0337 family)